MFNRDIASDILDNLPSRDRMSAEFINDLGDEIHGLLFQPFGYEPGQFDEQQSLISAPWWYPLWDYVRKNCSDILDVGQLISGFNKNECRIRSNQALLIGQKLEALMKSGDVSRNEDAHSVANAHRPDICSSGISTYTEGDVSPLVVVYSMLKALNRMYVSDTIVYSHDLSNEWLIRFDEERMLVDFQPKCYFTIESVRDFAEFCRHSEGFFIR